MENILTLVVIGISIGVSAGLFGIGGALIATPMLKLFAGLPALYALATPLPTAIPAAISGILQFRKHNLVQTSVAFKVLLTAIPTNIFFSYISDIVAPTFLMVATAGVMMYVAVTFILRGWFLQEEAQEHIKASATVIALVGCLTGILSGLLAVGGGIVMVPAFVRIFKMQLKQAIATSLLCVAALSIPGTIVHGVLGHIHWQSTAVLALVSFPCTAIGARLALSMRSKTLERLYGTFMSLFALYFLFKNM